MKVVFLNCGFKESLRCAIFVKKMFSLVRPPPPQKKNKQTKKTKKNTTKKKNEKQYRRKHKSKIIRTKIARRRGFKRTTFNHIESYFYCPIKSSLSRKCFPSPPPPQNKTKENKRRKQYKTKHKSKKL